MTTAREFIRKQLKQDEGTGPLKSGRHMPYKCPAGYLTIGYGHNLDAKGITRAQAEKLLDDDIDETIRDLVAALPWVADLDEVRQGVLVMMSFQMGVGRYKPKPTGLLAFQRTLDDIKQGDYHTAAVHMLESKWGKTDSPKRALRLADMMRTGEWGME